MEAREHVCVCVCVCFSSREAIDFQRNLGLVREQSIGL